MNQVRSRLQIVGALAIATALVWGSGMLASALPQSERVHDAVAPGSRFSHSRPTYDQ